METSVLKILGDLLAVNLDWGDRRRELEERYARWVWKYWFFVGVPLAIMAGAIIGDYFRVLPYETYIVIVITTGVSSSVFAAVWFGWQGREMRAERADSNRLLGGRIPVAVAAYKIKTIPEATLLFLRAGGSDPWLRSELVGNGSLADFLSRVFERERGLKNYRLVGCWEAPADSVWEVWRKDREIFTFVDRSVGLAKISAPNPDTSWWENLERDENPVLVPHG